MYCGIPFYLDVLVIITTINNAKTTRSLLIFAFSFMFTDIVSFKSIKLICYALNRVFQPSEIF